MKIRTILDQIDMGTMALPEFQRGYVWNREQVRSFMQSLYRRYPVGSLLVWVTRADQAPARGAGPSQPAVVELILDGQQRMTTLYGIMHGKPPRFFDGNENAFKGLYFHLEDETFEFYMPAKMAGNPLWISVTQLLQQGMAPVIQRFYGMEGYQDRLPVYMERLNRLLTIGDIELHVERVTGEDKTLDVVVDIFNKVNSGGTKLSEADLALAQVCARWPEARDQMKNRLAQWREAGFHFRLEWLLRVITAITTGEASFQAVLGLEPAAFQAGVNQAEKAVNYLLNLIGSRLGVDHDRVLGGRYSFPLLARYLAQRGWDLDHQERDRLLFWYVHTALWGRYAGATETVLSRDLSLIREPTGALDRLIEELRRTRGDLRIHPADFSGWGRGSRFYPMLYMMTRVGRARDWYSGLELSHHLLGPRNRLELHHIFPKALLYQHGYDKHEVNALANMTFLTQEANLKVSNRDPAEYLEEIAAREPGVLESHWIPMEPRLWKVENYREFLAERRRLLAEAANRFLEGLYHGTLAGQLAAGPVDGTAAVTLGPWPDGQAGQVPTGAEDEPGEEEEAVLAALNRWVVEQGLPEGEMHYELLSPAGDVVAQMDLAWPDGLQPGLSEPVAILLNEEPSVHELVNQAGFRYFTDVGSFKRYVEHEILAAPASA